MTLRITQSEERLALLVTGVRDMIGDVSLCKSPFSLINCRSGVSVARPSRSDTFMTTPSRSVSGTIVMFITDIERLTSALGLPSRSA